MSEELTHGQQTALMLNRETAEYETKRLILDVTEDLLEAAERRGVSAEELARGAGMTRRSFARMMEGKREMTFRDAAHVAKVMELRVRSTLEPIGGN